MPQNARNAPLDVALRKPDYLSPRIFDFLIHVSLDKQDDARKAHFCTKKYRSKPNSGEVIARASNRGRCPYHAKLESFGQFFLDCKLEHVVRQPVRF